MAETTTEEPQIAELDPVLDRELIIMKCLCDAINELFADRGFAPFENGSELLDCDIGGDICCGRISISSGPVSRRTGPGWCIDTQEFRIRLTRQADTRCPPDWCKDGVHRCHTTAAAQMLKRERQALWDDLVRRFKKACGGCCSHAEIRTLRKFYSGKCGGHYLTMNVTL